MILKDPTNILVSPGLYPKTGKPGQIQHERRFYYLKPERKLGKIIINLRNQKANAVPVQSISYCPVKRQINTFSANVRKMSFDIKSSQGVIDPDDDFPWKSNE